MAHSCACVYGLFRNSLKITYWLENISKIDHLSIWSKAADVIWSWNMIWSWNLQQWVPLTSEAEWWHHFSFWWRHQQNFWSVNHALFTWLSSWRRKSLSFLKRDWWRKSQLYKMSRSWDLRLYTPTQSAFTRSKLIIETLEQGVKYVQS